MLPFALRQAMHPVEARHLTALVRAATIDLNDWLDLYVRDQAPAPVYLDADVHRICVVLHPAVATRVLYSPAANPGLLHAH